MFRFRVDNPADEMEVDDTDPTGELEQEQEPKRKTPEKPRLRISTTLKDKLKAAALAKGITMEHFIESRCGLPTAPQENHNTVSFSASVCLAQLSQLQQLAAFTRCPLHGDASTAQIHPQRTNVQVCFKMSQGMPPRASWLRKSGDPTCGRHWEEASYVLNEGVKPTLARCPLGRTFTYGV